MESAFFTHNEDESIMEFFQSIIRFFNYAGATQEEYESIFPEICEHNRKRLLVFSGVTIFFLIAMVVITYLNPGLGFGYYIYLIPLIIILAIFLTVRFLTPNRPLLLRIIIYVFISLLFLMAIYIGAIANKTQTAGTFLAFLLAIPMLFILRPWKNACVIIFFDALFILTVMQVKNPDVIPIDVINALVFGGIGIIVSTFMLMITVENFVIKDKMTFLAERDQLTKLRNRTSYEHRIPAYPGYCKKSLACIYADANGLHELNEKGGHLAGDIMLQFISGALQDIFGESHTYRIGGDEFVAFAVDMDEAILKENLTDFTKKVEEANYYVSVGYDIQRVGEIQMTELIKAAEEEMYREKSEYYQRTGNNR